MRSPLRARGRPAWSPACLCATRITRHATCHMCQQRDGGAVPFTPRSMPYMARLEANVHPCGSVATALLYYQYPCLTSSMPIVVLLNSNSRLCYSHSLDSRAVRLKAHRLEISDDRHEVLDLGTGPNVHKPLLPILLFRSHAEKGVDGEPERNGGEARRGEARRGEARRGEARRDWSSLQDRVFRKAHEVTLQARSADNSPGDATRVL
jgi:hypothetical protein